MTIPGYIAPADAGAIEIAETGTPLPPFTGGDVGILYIEVTDDASAVYLRPAGSEETNAVNHPRFTAGKLGDAVQIMETWPIARSALSSWELFSGGGTVNAVYQWAPISEWGE